MQKRWIGMLLASTWISAAHAVKCPEPPKQIARDVIVDTQGRLAALGKLGAAELRNKTQVTVRPLLDQMPNLDRVTTIQTLTSVFCQLLTSSRLDDREKLDRFTVFSEQVESMLNGRPAPAPKTAPQRVIRPPNEQAAVKGQGPRVPVSTVPFKSIAPGANLQEVTEYLAGRQPRWDKNRTYTASFARDLAGARFTEVIAFDDEDKAISHSLSTEAVRITGRNPRTVGPDPKEFCASISPKLLQSLTEKLGTPTQPLVTGSRSVPVDWSLLGYDGAPCHPISATTCNAEARATSSTASFQLDGSNVTFEATLHEVTHERAKTVNSNVYEKSSKICTVRIEDPGFVYLKALDRPQG